MPFVQLGDHRHHSARHVLEIPLSTAGNGDAALKCDHIAIPVGAFPAGEIFEDSKPIFVNFVDPYVLRCRVEPLAWLAVDEAIPIKDPDV